MYVLTYPWCGCHFDTCLFPTNCDLISPVCDMATSAIVGIIGPTDEISSMQARSVCDAIEIPHVQVHGDIETRNDALSISLYPKPQTLAQAYLDVIKGLGWDEFAVIYDVNDEVVLYKDIFKTARDKNWVVHLYQLDRDQPYRDTFMKIKRSGKNNIIIDVKHKRLMEVMKHVSTIFDTLWPSTHDHCFRHSRLDS